MNLAPVRRQSEPPAGPSNTGIMWRLSNRRVVLNITTGDLLPKRLAICVAGHLGLGLLSSLKTLIDALSSCAGSSHIQDPKFFAF
jgi:hypothetical protein